MPADRVVGRCVPIKHIQTAVCLHVPGGINTYLLQVKILYKYRRLHVCYFTSVLPLAYARDCYNKIM